MRALMASSSHPSPPSIDQKLVAITSTTFSRTPSSPTSDPKCRKSFWSSLAKRAKAALIDDAILAQMSNVAIHQNERFLKTPEEADAEDREGKSNQQGAPAFFKGFGAIASSLSVLSGTIGNALEEGLNLVETKASDLILSESHLKSMKKKANSLKADNTLKIDNSLKTDQQQIKKVQDCTAVTDVETQLKASRDVAMAMAAKAKLLLQELKVVKADLVFAKEHCTQLEEQNKRLHESLANGIKPDEEDLVRAQLETLLAEKARLLQENAYYARENQFLREIVECHRRTIQEMMDEGIWEAAEMAIESAVEDNTGDQPVERVISVVSS